MGLIVFSLAGRFAWLALTDPKRLAWVGESGGLSLALCLGALLFSPLALADAVLRRVTKAGKVSEILERRSESGEPIGYELALGEQKVSVSAELSSRLRVGDSVLVRLSPILDSLRELSKY